MDRCCWLHGAVSKHADGEDINITVTGKGSNPCCEEQAEAEDDAGVSEGEPESDGKRPAPVVHELARGVVDGRDVIGVEGVSHPEDICGDADSDAETLVRTELEVLGGHAPDQRAPPDQMQEDDHGRHREDGEPFTDGEGVPDSADHGLKGRRQTTSM